MALSFKPGGLTITSLGKRKGGNFLSLNRTIYFILSIISSLLLLDVLKISM